MVLDNFIPYLQPGHKIGKVRSEQKLVRKLNISFVCVQNLSANSGCVVKDFFRLCVLLNFLCSHGDVKPSLPWYYCRFHDISLS